VNARDVVDSRGRDEEIRADRRRKRDISLVIFAKKYDVYFKRIACVPAGTTLACLAAHRHVSAIYFDTVALGDGDR